MAAVGAFADRSAALHLQLVPVNDVVVEFPKSVHGGHEHPVIADGADEPVVIVAIWTLGEVAHRGGVALGICTNVKTIQRQPYNLTFKQVMCMAQERQHSVT